VHKQISWSQLEIFNLCPYKWWCQYVRKLYSASNIFGAHGSAMHNLLKEIYVSQNFDRNTYIEKWKEIFKKEYTSRKYPRFEERLINGQLRKGYTMICDFFETAEKYNLLRPSYATEKKITCKFKDYKVICILDSIQLINNKLTLIDYKTGAEKDNHKLQVTLYAEAEIKKYGTKIEQCAVWYLKENKIVTFQSKRKETSKYIIDTIREMEESFKTGVFEQRKHQYCKGCIAKTKGLCKK